MRAGDPKEGSRGGDWLRLISEFFLKSDSNKTSFFNNSSKKLLWDFNDDLKDRIYNSLNLLI